MTYTLTTQVTPEGAGTVTPSSGTYDEGSSVTISATPSENYSFKQWTGTGSGTANPLTFKIISNTTVTAEFEFIDADNDGVTDALDKCPDTPAGSTVNAEGCATSELDTDGDGVTDDIDKCSETPDGETVDEIGCTVPPKQFTLTVSISAEGPSGLFKINGGDALSTTTAILYDSGTVVELEALSDYPSYTFWEWSGDINNNQIEQNTIQVTMDADKDIIALFEAEPEPEDPFLLDANGVTIKVNENMFPKVVPGDIGIVNGLEYTAVDRDMLISMVQNGDDVSKVVTSLITNMNDIFSQKYIFNQDISSWDVSNVTKMKGMFYRATAFDDTYDISNWDVSNVIDMRSMFEHATSFNQNIGNWDVSSVTNMSSMFKKATIFNQDISNWGVSNVTNMSYMFNETTNFDQPIGTWDVSKVTNMFKMFMYAEKFNQDISSWDVSNVIDMSMMFYDSFKFNQDISSWNVSNVTNMSEMFNRAQSFNQDLSIWNVDNVTSCGVFRLDATNYILPLPNFTNCNPN